MWLDNRENLLERIRQRLRVFRRLYHHLNHVAGCKAKTIRSESTDLNFANNIMGIRKYIKRRRENKKEMEPVLPPDGGWGWIVCAAAFLIQFIVLGTMNNFGILYVKLYEDFGRKAFLTCEILFFMLACLYF